MPMDPMKSRRWIAAAALAAAVVFLVMVTGENGVPAAAPAPVSSSGAVPASDGGPPDRDEESGRATGGGRGEADRDEVVAAVQDLLDALGISPDELDGAENAGCRGGSADDGCDRSAPAGAAGAADATITIKGFAFGQPVTVAPGATVQVVNADAAPHNVTAADGSFRTSNLNQDQATTFTAPSTPGRYEFTCTLHPEMTGTLIVEERGRGRSGASDPSGSRRGDHDASGRDRTTTPSRESTSGGSDGY